MPIRDQDEFFLPDWRQKRELLRLLLFGLLLALALVLAAALSATDLSMAEFERQTLFITACLIWSAGLMQLTRPWLRHCPLPLATFLAWLLVLIVVGAFSAFVLKFIAATGGLFWWLRNEAIAAILGGILLHYMSLAHSLRRRQQAEMGARLQALQSRIRPHFLFNSMNLIAELVHSDPDKAETAIENLSHLFRATLRETVDVPIGEELELCQDYIDIEKLRLGERLQVRWQINAIPEEICIPLLTLQPLLENAIYHGVEHRSEASELRISVHHDGERVSIVVVNPTASTGARQPTRGHQMALSNIRERLQARYGETAKLTTSADRDVFISYLSYPCKLARHA